MSTERTLPEDERAFAEFVALLQQRGWAIRCENDGFHGNDYFLEAPRQEVPSPFLDRLLRGGWLENIPNGSGYYLNDEGRKAYLRSTDEMGDGKLIDPNGEQK